MPDPTYRISYPFNMRTRQWKYEFYFTGSLSSAKAAATRAPLLAQMSLLHAEAAYCPRVHISNVDGMRRDWDIVDINLTGSVKLYPVDGANVQPDVTNTSILLRLKTATGLSRYLTISGVPDDIVKRNIDGTWNIPSDWKTTLPDAFIEELKNSNFQIRAKTAVAKTDWSYVKSLTADPDTDNNFTKIFFRGTINPYSQGDLVEFSFDRKKLVLLPYRGIFKVVEDTPYAAGPPEVLPAIVIESQFAAATDPFTPGRMYIKPVGYTYPDIDSGGYVKINTRQRGTAHSPRGREAGVSFRDR